MIVNQFASPVKRFCISLCGFIRLLWSVMSAKRKRQLLYFQIISIIAALLEAANIVTLLPLLQILADKNRLVHFALLLNPLGLATYKQQLIVVTILFLTLVVASIIFRVFATIIQLRLSALVVVDIGELVFRDLMLRPFVWHLQNNSSKVLGNLTKDVDQVFGSIQAILGFFVNMSIVTMLLASLITLSPEIVFTVSFLLFAYYTVVFLLTRNTLRLDGFNLSDGYEKSIRVSQEAIGAMRDIILDRTQEYFISDYAKYNSKYRLAVSAINIKAQVPRFLIEGFMVIVVIIFSCAAAFNGGSLSNSIPLLGSMLLGVYRLMQPLQQCFNSVSQIQANQSSIERLKPFLDQTDSYKTQGNSYSLDIFHQCSTQTIIEIANVSYAFPGSSRKTLVDISIQINVGEKVAIVGPTGSGKSTLSDIMLGLLIPTEGFINIFGNNLHGVSGLLGKWRQRISHVPQNIYLIDSDFVHNIAFGVPDSEIDIERVRQVSDVALISEFITSCPLGYSTVLGERGVRLSGGQRQRVGIARALYKQPQLLLLDEATSSLDNVTESKLVSSIASYMSSLTMVSIAHRLSTIKNCNKIIYIDDGRVKAVSTYQELLDSYPDFFVSIS